MSRRSYGRSSTAIFFLACNISAQETMLSLEDAKRYAVTHNYGITALRYEAEEMLERHHQSNAPFLGKFGIATGMESNSNITRSSTQPLGYVFGSYNVFNRYTDVTTKDITRLEHSKSLLQLAAAEFTVKLDVEEIFHTFLYKKNLIDLKSNAIATNELHRAMVHQTRQKGIVSDADVMEFELRDANLRSDLIALNQELEDARNNLKRLLGEEIGSNITPKGDLQHQHVKGSLMEVLDRIQPNSQQVKIAAIDVRIARNEQKISDSKWLPQVDFEVKSGFLSSDTFPNDSQRSLETSIALVAKMDIFMGIENRWERQEKAANALKREALLKNEINVAIRKIEMGYRNLKVIEARADLEKDNIRFAEKYYISVLNEYRRGFKNSADLVTATEKIESAKVKKLTFEFDSIKQRIDVERVLGTSLEIEVEPNSTGHHDRGSKQ